ncbi:MAG: hypothetical protein HRF50_12635 [Phycisphaerae bacterium]
MGAEAVDIRRERLEEFEAAARRPLETRMRYAFIRTDKPVMDDAPYRSLDTMEDDRRWCEKSRPDRLGYCRATVPAIVAAEVPAQRLRHEPDPN